MYRVGFFSIVILAVCICLMACSDDNNPVKIDRTPPDISEVLPADGASVLDSVVLTVGVLDDEGVARVEFHIDDSLYYVDSLAPWEYSWVFDSLESGKMHEWFCVAYDAAGNSDTSGVQSFLAGTTIPEPPLSLIGSYAGSYSRTDQGGTGVRHEQNILWVFTDQNWALEIDAANMTDFCICECSGRYFLEDRLRLVVESSQPDGELCQACIEDLNPSGAFALNRSADTLRLAQLLYDEVAGTSILVEIKLLPVE